MTTLKFGDLVVSKLDNDHYHIGTIVPAHTISKDVSILWAHGHIAAAKTDDILNIISMGLWEIIPC